MASMIATLNSFSTKMAVKKQAIESFFRHHKCASKHRDPSTHLKLAFPFAWLCFCLRRTHICGALTDHQQQT